MTGTLFGIGLGPGDPELVTLKAVRLLREAPVVAFFAKAGRRGHARGLLDPWLSPGCIELPLHYPVTTEIPHRDAAYGEALDRFYEAAAADLAEHLAAGRDVALAVEGDPLFYGSFIHLHLRLCHRFPVRLVPGVTGMAGCWAAAGAPMSWGDDVLSVLPGTLPEAELARHLARTDAAVVMKIGRNLPKIRRAVAAAGRLESAVYVERGTMADELVVKLAARDDGEAPYFSIILVPGTGRRA